MLSMSVSNFQPMRHKNFKHAIPDYLVRGMTDLFPFRLSKKIDNSPDWGGLSGVGVLPPTERQIVTDSLAGRTPGFGARSLGGGQREAATPCFSRTWVSFLSFSLLSPFSKTKYYFLNDNS